MQPSGHTRFYTTLTDATIDHADRRLLAGKLGKDGTLTFARPKGPYYVLFDVGPGHQAVVEHDEISLPRASDRARWVRK